ncbi:MAG TPA: sigma-54-dependent Fis family transcriptional regulator [Bacteroidetes bacterium]|nr:sigma-54-dependent Fis family transcriptional regulator [Bacteroidota bacterium]
MKILIIDDEKNIRRTLTDILQDEGYQVVSSENGEHGLSILSKELIDLVLLDVKLPGMDGIEVLEKIKESYPNLDVIMISGHSTIKIAVQAVKMGAYDFLEKPLSLHKIVIIIKHIAEKRMIYKQYNQYKESKESTYQMIGVSPEMEKVRALIKKVAPTNSKVLIRGESGTGKELVAYEIHRQSQRANAPFVKFNSAAIPNELVESELFGYEKGAFTDAGKRKHGKLELANEGTLFLDEIGDMSLNAQAKILRVIQEGKFERIGGNQTLNIDVRIIAATNKNLEQMIETHEFRQDLFYRLNVIPIYVPPLRTRTSDIPFLVKFSLNYFSVELKQQVKHISSSAMELLSSYDFPGNIRELRNLIERLCILTDGNVITDKDILPHVYTYQADKKRFSFLETKQFNKAKEEFETYYLRNQLEKFNWNITNTAQALELQQSNLSRKLKYLGIAKE